MSSEATEAATSTRGHFERITLSEVPLDSARVLGGRLYHEHELNPLAGREPPSYSVDALVSADLTLGLMRYSSGVHIVTGHLGSYHVNIPLDEPLSTASGRHHEVIAAGHAAVYHPDRPTVLQGWQQGGRVLALKISRQRLEEQASWMLRRAVTSVDFDLSLRLDHPRGREWLSLVRLLSNALVSEDSLAHNALVGPALTDSLIGGLLLVSGYVDEGALEPALSTRTRPATRSEALDRAVQFVRQNAEKPLTTAAIAAAAGTSSRTLQAAFRADLVTTPHEFLRSVRLERTRDDLLRARPRDVTVAEVARRWGFTNLGRFAAQYTRVYGESPKATLRGTR